MLGGTGFPGGSVVKNPPASAGDAGLILGHRGPVWKCFAHRAALSGEFLGLHIKLVRRPENFVQLFR